MARTGRPRGPGWMAPEDLLMLRDIEAALQVTPEHSKIAKRRANARNYQARKRVAHMEADVDQALAALRPPARTSKPRRQRGYGVKP